MIKTYEQLKVDRAFTQTQPGRYEKIHLNEGSGRRGDIIFYTIIALMILTAVSCFWQVAKSYVSFTKFYRSDKAYNVVSMTRLEDQVINVPARLQGRQMGNGFDRSPVNGYHPQFLIEELPKAAAPPPEMVALRPRLHLSGIMVSPDDSYCVINGSVVRVGDVVGGARVIMIHRSKVVVKLGEEIIALRIAG